MSLSTAPIQFREVTKTFSSGPKSTQALREITFDVSKGEIFGIIGRSGAGKSTLLRLINHLEKPTSGTLLVNGQEISDLDESGLLTLRRNTGMIFQHFNLLSAKSVIDNIALPLTFAGWHRAKALEQATKMLDLVGLEAKRDAYPSKLSGGQKQRVGIARALVQSPSILLCDEATSALDPETTQSILALLKQINRDLGITIVLITHEMSVIRDICDRVAVLERGELVEIGPVWRVFGEPQAEATQALLRTVVQDIPESITSQLSQERSGARYVVLEARYFEDRALGPDLSNLLEGVGRSAYLLHGGLERIGNHSIGRLVFVIPISGDESVTALTDRLSLVVSRATVLGYANHL